MIRVIFGEDEYSVATRVRELRNEAAGDAGMGDANVSAFEGERVTIDQLLQAAAAMPFLAEKRVVIVSGLLGRIDNPTGGRRNARAGAPRAKIDVARLTESIQALPSTTELIFADGALRKNGAGLRAAGPGARIEEYPRKKGKDLLDWIAGRFAMEKARASPAAVTRLAELVGDNTRALDQEIRKLATYAGEAPVQSDDVDLLVAPAREANVFVAVDAVLERRPTVATRSFYVLMAGGQSVQSIIALIGSQVRKVLIARELLDSGMNPVTDREEMAARLGISTGFPLQKTVDQARRFQPAYMAGTMRRLLEADVAIKNGQLEERLALELLAARLSSGG